jgi:pimeloyl-ACP methyl ester carboxylesterase
MTQRDAPRNGTFPNGMDFSTWGSGSKTLLFLPGGPGSSIPRGRLSQLSLRWFVPFVEAGYVVWLVTRRRNMPRGHTVEDMANDYADVIAEELGGRVDLVVGESYGGMIAQYIAASHAESFLHVAIVVAAAEVSDWGKEVDSRLASALERDDTLGFGMAFAEYAVPGRRSRWLRRLAGPWIGRSLLSGKNYPPTDLAVEIEAELAFDSRPVLTGIAMPVLLVVGDRDRFFPARIVEETASLIPDCTVIQYEGHGHMKVATSRRVAPDVLAFVDRRKEWS